MPTTKVSLVRDAGVPDSLTAAWQRLRVRLEVPDVFPEEVLAAARTAAASVRLPEQDRTDLDFITIDPEGSRDLDQALCISAEEVEAGPGYRVDYAIADVAAFVDPGGLLDQEAHRRGLTFYAPDRRTPLYPSELSEGGASLLPGQLRPALVWTLRVDAGGVLRSVTVDRARVRSRAQLSYPQAQQAIEAGDQLAGEPLAAIGGAAGLRTLRLLAEVGALREQQERERGGVSLNLPEQVVDTVQGTWRLSYRAPLPVEGWNAQVSLLTGIAAAQLQLAGRVGILRTLPPADRRAIRTLRHTAAALRIDWPDRLGYPDLVRTLDPARPADAAMLTACTALFRGAGYVAFHDSVPAHPEHAALAVDYAHATAPLRRLVDRYTGEICVALSAGRPVPDWVLSALDRLPKEMGRADQAESRYGRAVLDLAEAFVLADHVGETFQATVVDVDDESGSRGRIMITEPAVEAKITGTALPLGRRIAATLVSADLDDGTVAFEQL